MFGWIFGDLREMLKWNRGFWTWNFALVAAVYCVFWLVLVFFHDIRISLVVNIGFHVWFGIRTVCTNMASRWIIRKDLLSHPLLALISGLFYLHVSWCYQIGFHLGYRVGSDLRLESEQEGRSLPWKTLFEFGIVCSK